MKEGEDESFKMNLGRTPEQLQRLNGYHKFTF